ncbi:hypothetical protein FVEN_g6473 [Fusarium venenatum]|nr:hypothetical protein FVEN_g6473 [Fusarium venenatum]
MAPQMKEPDVPKIISSRAIKRLLVNGKTRGLTDEQEQERKAAHCEPFLPNKDIESLVQEANVKATLNQDKLLGSHKSNKELAEYVVKAAPRAFLTAIFIGADQENCIRHLKQKGFVDAELPIRLMIVEDAEDAEDYYRVCRVKSNHTLPYFSGWKETLQENYETDQWTFLAPTFEEDDFSYEFHQNLRLPFVYIPNSKPDGGYFGKVLKLGLRIDHQKLTSFEMTPKFNEKHIEVAVKFMNTDYSMANSDVKKFYEREKTTLKLMRELKDLHLIRAIAAYTKGTSRCFVFPWAEGGNLDTFWRTDRSCLDKSLVRWALDQMTGIAGGIMKLHAKDTRHGDIKPLNILYFLDSVDERGRGILKVADVGLAKVHTEYTKYRAATTTRMSSERYEPPEMLSYLHKKAAIPRRYDSWSLGCVFLEFTVWLIYGRSKLHSFHQDLRDSLSDKFYETKGDSYPRHHVVNQLINEMEQSLSESSALHRLVRLISEHLLVPVDNRMSTKALYEKIDDIRKKCHHKSYSLDSSLVSLAKNRPMPDGHPDNNLQPPDNYVNSEWARFLVSRLDWPSLRPTIVTEFCDACSSIDFLEDSIELNRTLHDLEEGSVGCSICSFLFRSFSMVCTGTGNPIVDQSQRLSLSQNDHCPISFYLNPDHMSPAPRQAQLGLPVLPKLGSPQEFALLNEWINLCDRTHDCVSRGSDGEPLNQMPTRLIHVGTTDAPSLHLVETAKENITGNYIALSHCWGKLSKQERFCTYIDNIQGFKQHIPFDELPQTFKDAVITTRALKVRYLWIDSLCIIQEDPPDWKIEAARMEDVFNSAYCTIAASSSASSLDGFLIHRRERAVIGINTSKGPLYLAEAIDDFREDVEKGILNTRGWVFQERALSRRTIHFTSTQVYWECGHGVHCETLAHLRNRESELLGDSKFPNHGIQKYKDDSIRLVQYLYQTYCALNLTNPTDRSKALLGLESRLGRTFRSRAVYGLLSAYFERLLLWQRDQVSPMENIPYPKGQTVPSWSWMSFMGKINYQDAPFGKVNWTGDVENPFISQDYVHWDGRLQARAHELSIDEDELKKRIRTDLIHSKLTSGLFKCAVVGTSKVTNEDGTTDQYVLLISQTSPGIFERVGTGILIDIHIRPDTELVYIN